MLVRVASKVFDKATEETNTGFSETAQNTSEDWSIGKTAKRVPLVRKNIDVILITGRSISLNFMQLKGVFANFDSFVFFGAAFALVTFLFPVASGADISWWMKVFAFAILFVMVPTFYLTSLFFLALISQFWSVRVFEPVILLLAAVWVEFIDRTVNPFVFGSEWSYWVDSSSFGEQVSGTFVMLLTLDILFCYFVLPNVLNRLRGVKSSIASSDEAKFELTEWAQVDVNSFTEASEVIFTNEAPFIDQIDSSKEDLKDVIELGERSISVSTILAVEADEHYVRVWTEDKEIYVRHSFKSLLERLGNTEGFNPRRGTWFSFRNIQSIMRSSKGKYVVVPYKGTSTIVPKAKVRELKGLMRLHDWPEVRGDRYSGYTD